MAGTNAYATLGEQGIQRARVLDLGFGGVAIELETQEDLPENLMAVLHVPILPPVRVSLKPVWSQRTTQGNFRVGCAVRFIGRSFRQKPGSILADRGNSSFYVRTARMPVGIYEARHGLKPKSSHPYWPDALTKPTDSAALKPWSWALERLEKSHNYWIATSRSDGRPHLMVVWAFGGKTRLVQYRASNAQSKKSGWQPSLRYRN